VARPHTVLGPGDKKGGADSLLPALGLPIYNAMEKPDSPLRLRRAVRQDILHSVPETVSFQQGDPRLRSINRAQLNPAHRYTPLISATDVQGKSYGDAACYIEFGAGPVKGGKLLYMWSSLTAGPVGSDILGDVIPWAVEQNVQ
ncbi:MAG TPA: hypothetical protein VHR86_01185, partial [Armatimonadota bacterium]|nr:hypothetical protein [Armatimonadota bacterium]